MITIFPNDHVLHDPPHELLEGRLIAPHESPARARIIHDAVESAALGPIMPPRAFGLAPVRAVHSDDYLQYLEHAYTRWVAAGGAPAAVIPDTFAVRWMAHPPADGLATPGYYTFDTSAPIVAGTYRAARMSADAALTGAALLLEGERAAYALCRPPGHHAGRDMCGGYCFLNNAAIAAEYLLSQTKDQGRGTKVAILDIDYHHGNGTQQIFYERGDVLCVSLHADPVFEYPSFSGYADERGAGAGVGFNLNMPLPEGTDDATFLTALEHALQLIQDYAPRFLVLSAGFDTFDGDPLGTFMLTSDAYREIGARSAALGMPTLIVQEGGYATAALGENVVRLLRAFD
jgi:acetoin utilization deacetylase AcuC-like enzyme